MSHNHWHGWVTDMDESLTWMGHWHGWVTYMDESLTWMGHWHGWVTDMGHWHGRVAVCALEPRTWISHKLQHIARFNPPPYINESHVAHVCHTCGRVTHINESLTWISHSHIRVTCCICELLTWMSHKILMWKGNVSEKVTLHIHRSGSKSKDLTYTEVKILKSQLYIQFT